MRRLARTSGVAMHVLEDLSKRYGEFYSAFCTQYPCVYANRVQPALRLLRVADARRHLFAKDPGVYGVATNTATDLSSLVAMLRGEDPASRPGGWGPGMDVFLSPEHYPLWIFVQQMVDRGAGSAIHAKWLAEYRDRLPSIDGSTFKPSRWDALRLSDLMWHVMEGYAPLVSRSALEALVKALKTLPDWDRPVFCDAPFLNLFTQLALNQLGYAHHPVLSHQWRARYRAKRTTMYLDAHLFDQCRPLYDWLPAVDLYPEFFSSRERQLVVRIAISLIEAQGRGIVPGLYSGSALADRFEYVWSRWASPNSRQRLKRQ
jgi:hypothetical protein